MLEPDRGVVEAENGSVARLIGLSLIIRTIVDSGVQMFLTFLPVFAAGLGTSTIVMGRLVSARSATGLLAPLAGLWSDRRGYQSIIRGGLLLMSVGYFIVGLSQSVWQVGLGLVLAGIGTFSFIPALMAYLSARLPYARRARGLGIVEYAWALAGIFGLSLIGEVMAQFGWRPPVLTIATGGVLGFLAFGRLPPARSAPPRSSPRLRWSTLLRELVTIHGNARSAWSAIALNGLIMFAAINVVITFGAWLIGSYGLDAAGLGRVALLLGVADLMGSFLVSAVVDRAGKRRSVLAGLAAMLASFVLLPAFDRGLAPAVAGLILVRFAFEFTLVSNLALVSEQSPAERGKVLTLAAAGTLAGSTVGGLTGPLAFERLGLSALVVLPALATAGAAALLLANIREPAPQPTPAD